MVLTPTQRMVDAARMVLACSSYIELPFHLSMTDVGSRWVQGLRELRDAVYDLERSQHRECDHDG